MTSETGAKLGAKLGTNTSSDTSSETSTKAAQRGADVLVRALQHLGVEKIFTLSGNHIMPIYDALVGSGIELIHTRHEAACVHMADAYARVSGKVGVALVTGGPGHANAVSALYTAAMAESPIVLLSGHAPLNQLGMGAFQEMLQVDVAAPLTKAAWLAQTGAGLPEDMAKAFGLASSGRPGPVHVSLPSDVLENQVAAMPALVTASTEFCEAGAAQAKNLVAWLREGKRPLILAGPMFLTRASRQRLTALEAATGVPAIGMQSPRGVADPALGALTEVLAQADRVLLLGKRMDFTLKFGQTPLTPSCMFAVVDSDSTEIERAHKALGARVAHSHIATPGSVLDELCAASSQNENLSKDLALGEDLGSWRTVVEECLRFRPLAWSGLASQTFTERLHPVAALSPLQALLDSHPDSVLISDGGEIGQWAQALLSAPHRVFNGVAGSIGGAISFALGARAAIGTAPPIIAVMGDGTFGFHCAEFDTAQRHNLAFIAVIGNDERWNAEYQIQLREYGQSRAHSCTLLPTRYEQVAAAFGAHGEHVTSSDALPSAVSRAVDAVVKRGQSACINIMIDGVPAPNLKR